MRLALFLAAIAMVLSGCSTYAASRYSISADNVVALRSLNGKVVNVGPFTATTPGQTDIMCRGVGPIKTPDGEPFSEFVRKALLDELRMANAFSASAPVTLTGNLDSVDFSSTDGTWNLSLTVKSSNGKSMSVSESYPYTSSFSGETACNQTAQAFMPAVQNLVGNVVRAPDFSSLVCVTEAGCDGGFPSGVQTAGCSFPMQAPKYQIGETWIFEDAKQQRRMVTVVGFEGELVAFRYGQLSGQPGEEVRYFDANRILRKVVKSDGTTVDQPAPQYQTIGKRTLGFPLTMGSKWQYTTESTAEREPTTFRHSYEVVGCEEVTTRAGKFLAVKIEYRQNNQKFNTWGERTFWFAPSVKIQIRAQNGRESRPGYWRVLDEELIEYREK